MVAEGNGKAARKGPRSVGTATQRHVSDLRIRTIRGCAQKTEADAKAVWIRHCIADTKFYIICTNPTGRSAVW